MLPMHGEQALHFSPTITLFIDGKGTTHKDKYKYTILTGKQFEETFENAQWGKVKKCNQCDFASSRADNLRTYLTTHSGKKLNK